MMVRCAAKKNNPNNTTESIAIYYDGSYITYQVLLS